MLLVYQKYISDNKTISCSHEACFLVDDTNKVHVLVFHLLLKQISIDFLLKTTKIYILHDQMSDMFHSLKSTFRQDFYFYFWGSKEFASLLFPASRGCLHSLACSLIHASISLAWHWFPCLPLYFIRTLVITLYPPRKSRIITLV